VTGAPEDTPPLRKVIDDPLFDDGSPIDADALRRAAEFMSTARLIQRESGRSLSGRVRLTDETLDASSQARQGSTLLTNLSQGHDPVVNVATQQKTIEEF
jgi:hypothetical protein